MRKYLNKYAGIFLGLCLFAWVGYSYFLGKVGERPVLPPLILASFLLIQGLVPISWLKQLSKEKKVLFLGIISIIVGSILWGVFQFKLLAVFSSVLLVSLGLMFWYEIPLKRFFLLVFLPPLIVAPLFVLTRLLASVTSLSNVTLPTVIQLIEGIFLAIGANLFVALFATYLMFPVLILFSTTILVLEKVLKLNTRALILLAPIVGLVVMASFVVYVDGVEQLQRSANFIWPALVTPPAAVAIEQYFYQKKKNKSKKLDG